MSETDTYVLSLGAVHILSQKLGTPQWYKDEPQQGKTLVRAVGALDALPDYGYPTPSAEERTPDGRGGWTTTPAYTARVTAWGTAAVNVSWLPKHVEAVKACISYYLKQASLPSDSHTSSLLRTLGLDGGISKEDVLDPPKLEHHEIRTGAVELLRQILSTAQWYKDDAAGRLVVRASEAAAALPLLKNHPMPEKGETDEEFGTRVDVWSEPVLEYQWAAQHKEAAKKCMSFYLRQGAFSVNHNTLALLKLLGLSDE